MKRCLLLGRKVITNLDSIFKSRDIANKGPSTQGYGFSSGHVWMWELDCEDSWVLKNWCFWRCWRRLLRVPCTAMRSNQSILKEISPGCSLEGLLLKLKLQYFGHPMPRVDSLEKTLMLRGIGGRRRRGQQRMRWHHWVDGHEFEWTQEVGDGQGGLVCCTSLGLKEMDTTERLNWTQLRHKVGILKSMFCLYNRIYEFTKFSSCLSYFR